MQFVFAMVAMALVLQITFILAYKLLGTDRRAALRATGVMGTFNFAATATFMGVSLA